VVCIAVTNDSSLSFKGECLQKFVHWDLVHIMHLFMYELILLKVAHQANILVETFLIVIKKCLLSCLVGNMQDLDGSLARIAGSSCK